MREGQNSAPRAPRTGEQRPTEQRHSEPRVSEQRNDREINGNSKSYTKDTDFQFARALTEEFGQRRPRSSAGTPSAKPQERFGNPNAGNGANRGANKPRTGGKPFGEAGGIKRPRSFA
jgi:hypothetical protein